MPKSKPPEQKQYGDFKFMWAAYKRARKRGESFSDALRTATEDDMEFQRTGKVPEHAEPVVRPKPEAPPQTTAQRLIGLTQSLLVNAVTVIGVFQLRWPVGTGLALYWAETFVTAIAILILFIVWRIGRDTDRRAGEVGGLIGTSFAFNIAHFIFLLFFLALVLPQHAPGERFDRTTFVLGLEIIGLLVGLDFFLNLLSIRSRDLGGIYDLVSRYIQRIGVLHLTIVFGMFALALFGSARAFFAVFSGLKLLVDVTRRL